MPTHQVTNQPPAPAGYDASDDRALRAALTAFAVEGAAVVGASREGAVGTAALARQAGRCKSVRHSGMAVPDEQARLQGDGHPLR